MYNITSYETSNSSVAVFLCRLSQK